MAQYSIPETMDLTQKLKDNFYRLCEIKNHVEKKKAEEALRKQQPKKGA